MCSFSVDRAVIREIVKMPKVPASTRSKLEALVKNFGSDVFSTDGQLLFCKVCERAVCADKKFLVSQHVTGMKHKALLSRRREQLPQVRFKSGPI